MKKKSFLLILTAVITFTTACGNSEGSYELTLSTQQMESLGKSKDKEIKMTEVSDKDTITKFNEFGLDLFSSNANTENPVISPLSAYLALHMVAEGADGNTKTEFETVLGNLNMQRKLTALAKEDLISDTTDMTFSITDSAWIDDDLHVNEEWLENILSYEQTKAFQMNLSTQDAMEQMNQWVKNSTNGMIDKMIDEPLIDETRFVLFDAIYLKGKWKNEFSQEDTHDEEFYLAGNESITVPMMNQYEENYTYLENEDLEGAILPYKNSSLAFVAIKPKSFDTDIRTMMDNFSSNELLQFIQSGQNKLINLKLPTFEIAFEKNLNGSLQQLGIQDAFDPDRSDLSKIGETTSKNPMYVSLVYQKAKVNVNEEGTEAAAVTEIIGVETTACFEPVESYDLYFNQPFFYMIMDTQNQLPVFMGILDRP